MLIGGGGDAFLVRNLDLHVVNSVAWLNSTPDHHVTDSLLFGVDNKQLYVWKLLSNKISVLLRGSYNLFPFIITTTLWSSKDKNEDDDNDNTTTTEYRISELTSTPQTPLNTQLSTLVSI